MDKSILILDKSQTCGTCRLCIREQSIVVGMPSEQYEKTFCGYTKEKVDIKTIHERCPLKPLPNYKINLNKSGIYKSDLDRGYDNCLEKLLGETHE